VATGVAAVAAATAVRTAFAFCFFFFFQKLLTKFWPFTLFEIGELIMKL